MSACDIVVVGGSAGAVEAFREIVRRFPSGFPAAVFIVLHVPVEPPSLLPEILSRAGALPATHAIDGEPVRHGHIYIAPPDRHLTLENGTMRVKRGPRENRHRPAIDPLFRTAARVYGPRVIGVLCSGHLDDGSAGLRMIRSRGGKAIVQDPKDALTSDMPQAALQYGGADHVLPAAKIGSCLVTLVNKCGGAMTQSDSNKEPVEGARVEQNRTASTPEEGVGTPSTFACPECHGVLWELNEGELVRFRCRVGHAYTLATLAEEQQQAVENALWAAMRALDEKSALGKRLAGSTLNQKISGRLIEQAEADRAHADVIRNLIFEDEKDKERNQL